jgi:hypothetical protein
MSLRKLMATAVLASPFLLLGCADAEDSADQQEKELSVLKEWNIKAIELPSELYDLPKGSYEITVNVGGEEKDCIANLLKTTHGRSNVVLTNCM